MISSAERITLIYFKSITIQFGENTSTSPHCNRINTILMPNWNMNPWGHPVLPFLDKASPKPPSSLTDIYSLNQFLAASSNGGFAAFLIHLHPKVLRKKHTRSSYKAPHGEFHSLLLMKTLQPSHCHCHLGYSSFCLFVMQTINMKKIYSSKYIPTDLQHLLHHPPVPLLNEVNI